MNRQGIVLAIALVLAGAALGGLLQDPGPGIAVRSGGPVMPGREMPVLDASLASAFLSARFVENLGQLPDDRIRYYAEGDPLSVAITDGGVIYSMRAPGMTARDGTVDLVSFSLRFHGSRPSEPYGVDDRGFVCSFFLGDDPGGWASGVKGFQEVRLDGVYDGVDVRFRLEDGLFKYYLEVAPGARVDGVVLVYDGVDRLEVEPASGDLLVRTGLGTLRDSRPVVMQRTASGAPTELPGDYELIGQDRLRFTIPDAIDRRAPFTVDPGVVFSTYLGGGMNDIVEAIDIDGWGNVHVVGLTSTVGFPPENGYYRESQGSDVFGMIIPQGWGAPVAGYRIGGNGFDAPDDIRVMDDGSIWIAGTTTSTDFPTFNPLFGRGGDYDVFLLQLSGGGVSLTFSSYLSGINMEFVCAIDVDATGNVYITGRTLSYDFPTTAGAYCETMINPVAGAVYIAKFSPPPVQLVYCTFIDARNSEYVQDIAVDSSGRPYVVGKTDSTPEDGFPVTYGAYDVWLSYGGSIFIVRLNTTGTSVERGTYLGGWGEDIMVEAELMEDGSIILVGTTESPDFPTTSDAYSDSMKGDSDCILAMLDAELASLRYSTFFGSDGADYGGGLSVSSDETRIAIMGHTSSSTLPTTIGAFDSLPRGREDIFLSCFDLGTRDLLYSSYIGGSDYEGSSHGRLKWNGTGSLVLGGYTNSSDFPTSETTYNSTFGGGEFDGFLMEMEPVPCTRGPLAPTGLETTSGDTVVDLRWEPPALRDCQVVKYSIYRANESVGGDPEMVGSVASPATTFHDTDLKNGHRYRYTVSAWNGLFEGAGSEPAYGLPQGRPSPPAHLGYTTGDGRITLIWTRPPDDGGQLRGYHVMRGTVLGSIDQRIATVENDTMECVDDAVDIGAHYYYDVIAFNDYGNSTPSDVLEATPLGPPSVPRSLTAIEGDGYIDLGWETPDSDGGSPITGYNLFRGETQFESSLRDAFLQSEHEYRDGATENGKSYYYSIQAKNANGTSGLTLATKFPAIPFGAPSAPENLTANAGDGSVDLSWRPPRNPNGRPVTGYRIWVAQTPSGQYLYLDLGNVGTYRYESAVNDVTYYFKAQARNERDWGENSSRVEATPRAVPGPPVDLSATVELGGIRLTWTAPEWFGHGELSYEVHRGTSMEDAGFLHGGIDATSYLDASARIGVESYYVAFALNPTGGMSGPSNGIAITRTTVPGDVENLNVTAFDKEAVLTWVAPLYDGGSDVLFYRVLRGFNATTMVEVHRVQGGPMNWTDKGLINGQNYTYTVLAVNTIGASPMNQTRTVKPLAVCGMVILQPLKYKDGRVVLRWTLPDYPDRLPSTSFAIYKGLLPSSMELVITLDSTARNWTDGSVEAGKMYCYYILSICARGPGERTETITVKVPSSGWLSWVPILIIVMLAVIVAWMVVARRRTVVTGEPSVAGPEVVVEVGAEGPSAPGALPAAAGHRHIIEEVFVIYKDGRLIAECSLDTCKTADADLMSGMLIAVQGIVQEGLQKGGELESIKYGENLIVIKSGPHVNVAAIVYGEPDVALAEELEATVERIEVSYSGIIEQWDGDLTPLSGMTEMVKPLFERTADVTRADIKGPSPTPSVSLLSSIDFHRGYVRLKLAVVNATKESVTDASVEVHYDHDMLRLERVIPVSIEMRGDSIILGNVRPAERKSVALLLDPQICHGTHIDGTLVYYDPKGELHRTEMKRRRADVVCPIFFTKTHANTAMLRRLIKEKLHNSDVRAFRYADGMAPTSVLELGRRALAGNAIQMVRQFIREGPPYYAEVWYYGETKVKGHQIVMRLGVIEEKRALEFFVASTDIEPITGLLADFKRELDRLLAESYPGRPRMAPLRSEAVLGEIESRTLLIDERDGPMVE